MKRFRGKQPPEEQPSTRSKPHDLSSLLAASQAVNSAMGLQDALRIVLSSAKELCGAHEGSVMLLDPEGYLRVLASEGIPSDLAAAARIGPGEGVSGKVAQTGLPVLITSQPEQRQFESFVHQDRVIRSSVSVPLKAAAVVVGVLNLNLTSGDRDFTEEDMRRALLFGEHAAMAIYKTKLFEEAQSRSQELSSLLEASQGLMGILELEPLMTRVLDGAMKINSARAGFVCLLDESAGQLSLAVYQGIARNDIRQVLSHPRFLELFPTDGTRTLPFSDAEALRSVATATEHVTMSSLKTEGTTKALVVLVGSSIDPSRSRMYQTFAAQAGLAIRNAQLYHQVDEKETELASIVYSMNNPVVVVDSSGRLIVANPAAEELFAFSTDFLKGQPVRGLLGDEGLESILLGSSDETIEVFAGGPMSRLWKARASTIRTPDARPGGRLLVMDDVTSEREIEKLKADFVAVMGHEFRTPLTLTKGFVKTLLRSGDKMTPEQRNEALMTIEAQTQRLERLVEDLLYVSQIEKSRPPLHLEVVNLVALCTQLVKEFRARESRRQIDLLAPSTLLVTIDRTKTEQIVFHLLDNACKYSDATSPVSVSIGDRPGDAVVEVIDKGVGILSGDLEALFQRFHQVDATSTRVAGGTGVGLYICKAMVDAHGGRLDVSSVWGKGSTFSFTIPKDLVKGGEPRLKTSADPGLSPSRIPASSGEPSP